MNSRWAIFLAYVLCFACVVWNYWLGNAAEYKWLFLYAVVAVFTSGCDALNTIKRFDGFNQKAEEWVVSKFPFMKWFK